MSDPRTNHDAHDPQLIAALLDRDLAADDGAVGRALLASCAACAALHADLVALASATRRMPLPERPRDFRLRPADAQRLRPNLVRRILGVLGTPRDSLSRPLAMGLTTIGLAGLLVGTVPAVLPIGGAATGALETVGRATDVQGDNYAISAAPEPGDQGASGGGAEAPAASAPAAAAPSAAPPAPAGGDVGQIEDGPEADPLGDGSDPSLALAPDPSGLSTVIVVSGSLLIAGLGLFALRWTSRRFGG